MENNTFFSIPMKSIVKVDFGTSGNFIVESDVKLLSLEYLFKMEVKEDVVSGFRFENFKSQFVKKEEGNILFTPTHLQKISIPILISMDSGEKFETEAELDFSKSSQIVLISNFWKVNFINVVVYFDKVTEKVSSEVEIFVNQ
jgi:hypothetical protein